MYQNTYFYQYNPYGYEEYFRRQNDVQLINDIQRAINGQYSAIECYKQLAEMAQNEEDRKTILEIREDEKRHLEEFRKIYTSLTGRQPTLQITEKCPEAYREGLVSAFKDEQETVDFYLDISDRAENLTIKETFRRAAADEQNHAVWFLFFLQQAQQKV